MRLAASTILLTLCWAACSAAGPDQPLPIEVGQSFSLRAGQSAQTGDGALRIGFESVSADSRCPKGERCVWAGDATVRIWLQRRTGAKEWIELHTTNGDGPGVRLLRLDPVPIAGKVLAQRDYVATLALSADR
jgi:hypothetical protein